MYVPETHFLYNFLRKSQFYCAFNHENVNSPQKIILKLESMSNILLPNNISKFSCGG